MLPQVDISHPMRKVSTKLKVPWSLTLCSRREAWPEINDLAPPIALEATPLATTPAQGLKMTKSKKQHGRKKL